MSNRWRLATFLFLCLTAWQACAQLVVTPGPAVNMGAAPPGQVLETRLSIQNTGSTRAFADIHLWGGQFWLHRSTCTLPLGMAAGASCQVIIRFSAATVCSNYHADLDVTDWSGQQAAATVVLTASGGVGSPECNQTQYAETSRWKRVLGPYPGTNTYAGTFVTVADLGNDGEMDAILSVIPPSVAQSDWYTEKLTQVYVYTYTADGQFIETTARWFGVTPLMMPSLFAAAVADFNGDGKDDIAFACNNEDGRPINDPNNGNPLWHTHHYAFMSGPGNPYAVQALSSNVAYGTGLSAADIDRDGDVDILMSAGMQVPGAPVGESGMYMLVNNGLGAFTVGQVIPLSTPSNAYRNLSWPRFADLDADGDPDLLIGRGPVGDVAVLRNDGGSFFYQRDIALFPGVYNAGNGSFHVDLGFDTASIEGVADIQVADMDGDGVLDFVAWATGQLDNQPFGAAFSVVRVARGLTGLDFQPLGGAFDLADLGGSLFIQVLPVNGDGAPDVFLRSQSRWEGRVQHKQLRNIGNGQLRYENMLAYPANDPFPDTMHLADMNHDGRLDLVYTFNGPYGSAPGQRGVMINAMPASLSGPLQSLSVNDVSTSEGNGGSKQAQFTVSLSQPALTSVSFDAFTTPGTAAPGVDYQSNAAIAQTIPAGATSASFAVTVNGDIAVEGHETFTVNLANPLDAGLGDGQGLGRIVNDDLAQLSIADASVTEGNSGTSTVNFVVQLSSPMPNPITFDIATSNGAASAGSDYVARSQTNRFLDAGRTRLVFEVTINGDSSPEPNENFTVTVSNVSGAVLGDGSALGTIVNDDVAARPAEIQVIRTSSTRLRGGRRDPKY
ncbi:MAG: FG-GAP-like repeat-containing protein [Gammaproteobacteria bacterium]|nr:FG-GAP-like repeat-containing protein [Gammaproteobacteria bacterium]